MTPLAPRFIYPLPSILTTLAVFASCIALAPPAHAQSPKDPQISGLRLGFDGAYKLGYWTQAEVTLVGGDAPETGVVEISVPDADGVPTSVFTPPDRPVGLIPGQKTVVRLFVRSGQDGADIVVRFIDDRGKERAKRIFSPGTETAGRFFASGMPATNRLIVSFGADRSLSELARNDRSDDSFNDAQTVRTVRLATADDLPLRWYGYEGVDALVLFSSRPEEFRPLAANPQRIEAIARWVELGGRLVIFCGAPAPELIGPDGPLAPLVPGKFDTLAPLRESTPLETFSGSADPVVRGQLDMQVPRLVDVEGRILAHAGNAPEDLPLVIRARRGFGEITFVALDPDAPPISTWSGRVGLLRQALQWPAERPDAESQAQRYPNQGNEDLVNLLRTALDRQFAGVKTAPFALVALLVIAYIALIGPGDYFLVKRVLKRMELTWITFPLMVLLVSVAAYWLAWWMKGDQLRVNQVEVVDVDLSTGLARGAVWTHFFSPRVQRYDLALAPSFAGQPLSEPGRPDPGAGSSPTSDLRPPTSQLVAWLGAPGYGLGGMQGQGGAASLFDRGYAFAPQLDAIAGLPVQEWSTKTLVARWSGYVGQPIEADLKLLNDNLLAGSVTNRTGVQLTDCVLMHANWAYQLPPLAEGAVAVVDKSVVPRPVRTVLTGATAGDDTGVRMAEDGSVIYDPASSDVARHVKAMMFFDAIGADAYASTPHRYQSFIDLSRLLAGDQAILLARGPAPGSNWTSGDAELASSDDRRWVFYRFIIPLKK